MIFRAADVVLLSKCDLLTVLDDFVPARAESALRALGRDTPMIQVAARRSPSFQGWLDWVRSEVSGHRQRLAESRSARVFSRAPYVHAQPSPAFQA